MNVREKAAIIAALLEVLGEQAGEATEAGARVWRTSAHPHLDSWAWQPRGKSSYRIAGRVQLHRGRRVGRF